ncbi:phospholipid:diacylglycerol acyltransferase [Dipsacomyces acuminosporus]|nr:phospholipid:diacylglycerol acyltransferase [Dipsacomyces acuminosporus]
MTKSKAIRRRKNKKARKETHTASGEALLAAPASKSYSGTPTVAGTPHEELPGKITRGLSSLFVSSKLEVKSEVEVRPRVKRRGWFILGVALGIVLAATGVLYTNPTRSKHIDRITEIIGDFEVTSLLPDSLLPDEFVKDMSKLLSAEQFTFTSSDEQQVGDFQPALRLVNEEHLQKKHKVIMVPGIISSGLESWSTSNCSKPYFRQRLWGTSTMFKAILLDKECWVEHMMLDKRTGLDPPGIKLRAAKGLDAADYFITGYWIWGKAIENLAVLGYDSNDMNLASYDWRLSYYDLERRDQYFSNLKSQIEIAFRASGEKTVLVAHSMGSQVVQYFIKWVESPEGGSGGSSWVNDHIEAIVNLAGTPLGVPKTLSSLLSGEQRETVQPLANYLLDHFMNRKELARIFRSWTGLTSLLPKGGDAIWGNLNGAPDDVNSTMHEPATYEHVSFGAQIRFDDGAGSFADQTMEESLELLMSALDKDALRLLRRDYSYGLFTSQEEMDKHKDDHRMWTNPLQHQLPNAPNMTIYCLYGHGVPTERAYYYTSDSVSMESLHEESGTPALRIDKRHRPNLGNVDIGVVTGDGDGTVPLLSLGYMCADGWRKPLFNPHGVRIVSREFAHSPAAAYKDIRGGAGASDHINILGNHGATADILRIVSGRGAEIQDQFTSNILQFAKKVQVP